MRLDNALSMGTQRLVQQQVVKDTKLTQVAKKINVEAKAA
jgi:hypothetical protein